jgi:hypothetical protein
LETTMNWSALSPEVGPVRRIARLFLEIDNVVLQ